MGRHHRLGGDVMKPETLDKILWPLFIVASVLMTFGLIKFMEWLI